MTEEDLEDEALDTEYELPIVLTYCSLELLRSLLKTALSRALDPDQHPVTELGAR